MPSIGLDSGPVVALFSRRDKFHRRAVAFVQGVQPSVLVTTVGVVVEVAFLLGGRAPQAIDWIRNAAEIDAGIVGDLPRITELLRTYHDMDPDFADASIIAMCERRGVTEIATMDGEFEIYRTRYGRALRNVF